jgi:hypothetical protein
MVMATPRVQITLRLDPSDYERLVLESRRTRRPACRIVRDLLDAHLPPATLPMEEPSETHSVPASGRVA